MMRTLGKVGAFQAGVLKGDFAKRPQDVDVSKKKHPQDVDVLKKKHPQDVDVLKKNIRKM